LENAIAKNQSTTQVAFSTGAWLAGLLFLFTWVALVWTRSLMDPGHYQTVDGTYYQELRDDLLAGRPLVLDGLRNKAGKEFSPYPPGFPALLALEKLAFPSGAGAFPQGFAVQLLLAVLVFFLFVRNGLPPWIPGILLVGDGFLEVSCHTWSEGPFTLLALAWVLLLVNKQTPVYWVMCFLALFSLRYAAVFFLPAIVILLLCFPKRELPGWKSIATALFLKVSWLVFETWRSGLPTGGDRYPNDESSSLLISDLCLGLLNQGSYFRDWSGPAGQPIYLMGLGFQVFLLFMVGFTRKEGPQESPTSGSLSVYFVLSGVVYLAQILAVRWYFYFAEGFDNRLLIPGGLLLWAGFLVWMWERGLRPGFWTFLICWLAAIGFGLPKTALVLHLQELIWGQTGPVFGP
jgi:hypothetical protein